MLHSSANVFPHEQTLERQQIKVSGSDADGCQWGLAPQSPPSPICAAYPSSAFRRTSGTAALGQERSVEPIAQFALERTLTGVQAAKMASPDHLVGTVQELLRHLYAHLASHAQIDDEIHLGDLLDR